MCSQQRITGYLWLHLAVAQDEVRQDREHRFARRTLDTPDSETTQADMGVMGVARQASAPATDGFVLQLKAEDLDEGEDTFEERLPIAKQLEVRRFAPEIGSDGAVFSRRFRRCAHMCPLCHQVLEAEETQ